MFLEDIQNRVRLSGAEVVRPDLVGFLSEEELHGVHVSLGQVDDMNVVPGHENDSFHVTITSHILNNAFLEDVRQDFRTVSTFGVSPYSLTWCMFRPACPSRRRKRSASPSPRRPPIDRAMSYKSDLIRMSKHIVAFLGYVRHEVVGDPLRLLPDVGPEVRARRVEVAQEDGAPLGARPVQVADHALRHVLGHPVGTHYV